MTVQAVKIDGDKHVMPYPARMIRRVLLSLCAVLLLGLPCQAGGFIQETGTGSIDWSSGLVFAEGTGGKPDTDVSDQTAERLALREALLQARGKLWQTLQSVRIDDETRLAQVVRTNEDVAERLRGLVHTARILERQQVPGGRLRVRVGLRLRGSLAKDVIPDTVWFSGQRQAAAVDTQQQEPGSELASARNVGYSGLIVDATGLKLEPALLARIFSQSGSLLYGPSLAEPDAAIERGLIEYVDSLSQAVKRGRVGKKPLIVRAATRREQSPCDVVIPERKAQLLRAAQKDRQFLRSCRVVIILDGT